MTVLQIVILALIQGAAELLPISSSAHVIVAEKLMGLDPSSPEMTFFLVMLHTGTMVAVMTYFWPRWRRLQKSFLWMAVLATGVTGVVGLGLKKVIEKVFLGHFLGQPNGEIEHLFKSLPLIAIALFCAGVLIIFAGKKESKEASPNELQNAISKRASILIGLVQALCLPFRGFSRSGATISSGLLLGISRNLAEDFSFALAVLVTPAVIGLQVVRLMKGIDTVSQPVEWVNIFLPGILGMVLSFCSGLLALKWLSRWLEMGRWKYFGIYCIFASAGVLMIQRVWF